MYFITCDPCLLIWAQSSVISPSAEHDFSRFWMFVRLNWRFMSN